MYASDSEWLTMLKTFCTLNSRVSQRLHVSIASAKGKMSYHPSLSKEITTASCRYRSGQTGSVIRTHARYCSIWVMKQSNAPNWSSINVANPCKGVRRSMELNTQDSHPTRRPGPLFPGHREVAGAAHYLSRCLSLLGYYCASVTGRNASRIKNLGLGQCS